MATEKARHSKECYDKKKSFNWIYKQEKVNHPVNVVNKDAEENSDSWSNEDFVDKLYELLSSVPIVLCYIEVNGISVETVADLGAGCLIYSNEIAPKLQLKCTYHVRRFKGLGQLLDYKAEIVGTKCSYYLIAVSHSI